MIGPSKGTSLPTSGATPGTSESKLAGQPNVVSRAGGALTESIAVGLLMPSSGAHDEFGLI